MNFENRPVLVFWETTRACDLACIHCRASAIREPLPGELSKEEGIRLIDRVAEFGRPAPVIIFTGGDPLKRRDLFDLASYAKGLGIKFAFSPAMTDLASPEVLSRMKSLGTTSISVSLDGATASTHDGIRSTPGTFDRTIRIIRNAVSLGLNPQVNTMVMGKNFRELPRVFHLIKSLGVRTWELFFLVKVGRGTGVDDITPEESEDVCNFLYDASRYGMVVRTVEAPFLRRVASERKNPNGHHWKGCDYERMRTELVQLEGEPILESTIRQGGTLDGDGIIFVAYDGSIHPGGLVPTKLGNVKHDNLVDVYRNNELLRKIRHREFNGMCGNCNYRTICGGSRARAYSYSGDPLASDPACLVAFRDMAIEFVEN